MRRGKTWALAVVAALLWIGGCTPGGGGGGSDCREADDACSAGFVCVAVGGGSNYACRAACADDGDCLRDEQCIEGLCGDRGPTDDAEVPRPVELDQGAATYDAEPDRGRIQILDAGPEPDPEPDTGPPEPDEGVVVLPGACEGTFDPSGRWLLGVVLDFAPDSPVYFHLNISVTGGGDTLDIATTPLRVGTREPLMRGFTELQGAPLSDDGRIEGRLPLYSPADGNRFGGGDVLFELELDLQLRPPDVVCGVVDGELLEPGPRALRGAIVSMVRWRERPADLRPFVACEDCLP